MRMVDVLLTGKDEWRYGEERANCRVETEAVAMRVMGDRMESYELTF